MSEKQPTRREPNPEAQKWPDYSGLHGRLFLASQASADFVEFIDLASNVDVPATLSRRKKDYTRITQKLSSNEREKAWEGVKFDIAYAEWKKEVAQAVNGLTSTDEDKTRLEALRLVIQDTRSTDLSSANFTEADAEALFKDFCNGDSDTTAFVKTAIRNATIDGHIDTQKLASLEWVSSMLFGQKTTEAVSRILELEVEIRNRPHSKTIKNTLFSDPTRVNNLNPDEKDMLEYLYYGLDKKPISPSTGSSSRSTRKPFAAEPAAQTTQPAETEDEEIRQIRASIAVVKGGGVPPFVSMGGPEAALRYLEKQLAEAIKRKSAVPAKPTTEGTANPEAEETLEQLKERARIVAEKLGFMRAIDKEWFLKHADGVTLLDNLYLSLDHNPSDNDLKKSIDLLHVALERLGVKKEDAIAIGTDYDPTKGYLVFHQAVDDEEKVGKVLGEKQAEYRFNGVAIWRERMIIVGIKAGSQPAEEPSRNPLTEKIKERNERAREAVKALREKLSSENSNEANPNVDLSDFLATRLGSIVGDFRSSKKFIVNEREQIVPYGPQYRFMATDESPVIEARRIILKTTIKGTNIKLNLVLSNDNGMIMATVLKYPLNLNKINITEPGKLDQTLREKIAASLEDFDSRLKDELNGVVVTSNPGWNSTGIEITENKLRARFIRANS
ncbi:MAG TPA: hypothetical protein VMR77_01005 [Patescibacteria group bacterium]|jgi:hypothetical protein|nr:hypothetical protein [Patescibacteria group bacterium]